MLLCRYLGPCLPLTLAWIFLAVGVGADLCRDYDENTMMDNLFPQSTPKGGMNAGVYLKEPSIKTLPRCLVACCMQEDCNVVFLHSSECFLIKCNASNLHNCDPQHRSDKKFIETYMIQVRSIEETSGLISPSTATKPTPNVDSGDNFLDKVQVLTDCDPSLEDSCRIHESCKLVVTDAIVGYQCQCVDGYEVDPNTHACVATSRPSSHHSIISRPSDYACTYGLLDECLQHEECILTSTRSRQGRCACIRFYSPDPETGWCVLDTDVDANEEKSPTVAPPFSHKQSESASSTPAIAVTKNTPSTQISTTSSADVTTEELMTPEIGEVTSEKTLNFDLKKVMERPMSFESNQVTYESSVNFDPNEVTTQGSLISEDIENLQVSSTTEKVTTTKKLVHLPAFNGVVPLVVSAGGNREIQLPNNKLTLTAFALPEDPEGAYKYKWTLEHHPDGDQVGQMDDINTNNLKLSNLIAGLYTFKVAVSTEGKYGESFVNITVLPPKRKNASPVAVVKPPSQSVNQPNDVVLDGSSSTDDDKIVTYKWEQVSGPLNSKKIEEEDLQKAMLVVKGLSPGNYTFKLTVTDSDGESNSTSANVTVIKEIDYPPKANAGSNVILSLPQNSITLYGNASTDDKEIISYEWIKKSDDTLPVGMTGVTTPFLHLENLEEGDYTFTLKVTDSSKQSDTAEVHVFVKPEHNKPPVAKVGKDKVVLLPTSSTTLDATNSTDDIKITAYKWAQISGPSTVVIDNADRAVATASKLVAGEYKFKVTVVDEEGLQSSAVLTVTVKENQNHPPKANAGGDQMVDLPISLVTLDGSASTDDRGIVSYQWTRSDKSLAAGDILNNSDHQAVLQLTNLVAGRYIFTLEVMDAEGLSNSDSASIIVKSDIHEEDMVEMEIDSDLGTFTYANKKSLENQLALLLHRTAQEAEVKVVIQQMRNLGASGPMSVWFYATSIGDNAEVKEGTEVVSALRKKLKSDVDVLDFRVINLDTLVCQNNCSGHGHCINSDKRCICEAFWMQNIFRLYLGDGQSNCDWSILYVIIITFTLVITVAGFTWGLVCLCKRWYKQRPKKRHRYTLLHEMDDDKDDLEMAPRAKKQTSSLMMSESDFTSDEETLFINHKKSNGHMKNGLIKPKSKIKT